MLVDHTRVLDFDVKRRYFRQELKRMDEGRGKYSLISCVNHMKKILERHPYLDKNDSFNTTANFLDCSFLWPA